MGFLDHSTNNIIVDAVLTDLGRQALAKNDGSFNIYQFALGDDEVDYAVIQQFGRTVGREKVEKNTPILEALTAGSLALKHKLLSCSNENLSYLPKLALTLTSGNNAGATLITLTRTSGAETTENLTAKITAASGQGIDTGMIDGEFRVEVNNLFLGITGEAPDIIYTDNIAVYKVPAVFGTGETVTAGINLFLKSFSDTTYNTFSISGGSMIRTFIKVIGINSGLSATIEVNIKNS